MIGSVVPRSRSRRWSTFLTQETIAQAIDLPIKVRHALWPMEITREIIEYLEPAQTMAESLSDCAGCPPTMGYAHWILGTRIALRSLTNAPMRSPPA